MISFRYHVLVSVNCAFCESTEVEDFLICSGSEVPRPQLPTGWRVVDGNPICSKHKVIVKDVKKRDAKKEKKQRDTH